MFQDNLPSIMERSLVLVIVFLSSFIVNAQESGSSLNNRTSTVVFQESQSSITSHLYPVTSASPYRVVKSEIKFVTMSSLSTDRTIAASNIGPNIFQSPVSIVSGPKDSGLKTPSVLQSPTIQQSQALSSSNKQPIAMQTSSDKHTQAPKTSLLPESSGSDTATAIQSDYLVPTQAKTTQQILSSVAESESSMHYSSTERVAKTVSSRLASSTSTAHASVSKSTSTVWPSLRATPARSTVPIQQNSSRIFLWGRSQSTQFPGVTSAIQGGITWHLSSSLSLDMVTMTTKGLPFLPVTPSPSSSNVTGYTSNATQSFGNSSTELASQGLSTQLLTKSTVMTEVGVSQSDTLVHPTSTQFPAAKSSSVMLSPPTASPPGVPDPPVILNVTVLSARSVFLTWNTTSAQSSANYSVEFSNDSFTWKNATCNQSSVPEACIVQHSEAMVSWLKPYTNYTFRVAAENSFGRSNYSGESKLILTDEAAPSGAPTITTADSTSSEAISIAWDPPALDTLNGKLRKYQLRLTEISTQPTIMPTSRNSISGLTSSASLLPSSPVPTTPSDSEIPVTTEPHREGNGRSKRQVGSPVVLDVGTAVSYEAHGLKKWTVYEVEVRAVTVAPGPFSNKLSVRTDEDVPSQPTELSAKAINSTTLFVNWTEPTEMNGVLLKYEVTYTEQGSSKSTTRPVGIGERSAVISSLNAFTFYSINVAAFTSKGPGNQSTVLIQTDEGQPSPPLNLSTQSVNSTAIHVSWQQPAHSNGKIKYRLSINTVSEQSAFYQVVYDGNNTQYLVSDLKPFTKYNLQVTAYNVKYNLSSLSVVAMETTSQAAPSGAPENARAVTNSSTSIIVLWTPPKTAEQNGEIISYTIYANSSDRSFVKFLNVTGNTTTLAVSGLQPYTDYLFMIQAVTVGGRGPYSHPVTNKTFEAEPSPPRNLTAKSVNSTAIRLKWVQPLHPNGVVRYKLSMRLSTEDESQNKVLYEGSVTAFVVSGLEEYVMYTFTVVSVNIKHSWTSTPVVAMETTHPAEPSGAPQGVRAMAKSSTSIIVEWSPPLVSERNGIIIQYTVEYEQDPAGESKSVNTTDNSTSFVVKDLAIFTKYSFKIRAWNVVGEGPESEPVYNTTLEDRPSPPTDLTTHTLNSSAIRVSWQIPLNANGEILYRLYYWQNSEGPGSRKLIYDGPLLEYIVAGLHEYVTYTFMLLAYNVRFEWSSTAVNASETTHPAEPSGPPLDVLALTKSSTSILVKWNPPSELDRNGVITHYIVTYNESLGSLTNITTSDNTTQKLVSSLRKYSPYYFTVQAVNNIGVGPPSDAVSNTTAEDMPSEPQDLRAWNTSGYSIEVSWKKPLNINGILKGYKVFYSASSPDLSKDVGLNTSTSLLHLKPYTRYKVEVQAFTGAGGGKKTSVSVKTDETAPSKVPVVRIYRATTTTINLWWRAPEEPNGEIGYYLHYWRSVSGNSTRTTLTLAKSVETKIITDLKAYTNYTIAVVAYNLRKKLSGAPSFVRGVTKAAAPSGPPLNVALTDITSTSMIVSWDSPVEPNGKIVGYEVIYYEKDNQVTNITNVPGQRYTIEKLKPFRIYRISVACKSSGGIGPYSVAIENQTLPGAPPPLVPISPPDKGAIQSDSFRVELAEASDENGKVSYYQVIVIELATDNKGKAVPAQPPDDYKEKDLYTYDEAREKKPTLVPYIAAEFNAMDFHDYKSFTVGDSRRSSRAKDKTIRRRRKEVNRPFEFFNGPLEGGTLYAVFLRAYVEEGVYSSSPWIEPVETAPAVVPTSKPSGESSTSIALIVGLVLVIVIVCILIFVGIIYVRRKRTAFDRVMDDRDDYSNGEPTKMKKLSRKRRSMQKRLMGSTESLDGLDDLAASRARRQPVPIDDFERHVDRMHMDGDHGFSDEYALVQPDEDFSFQQFLNPANKYKNRYANIVAYDHTRVLLNPIEGIAGSDYINANFIDGYNRQRAYIAAQGPLMETFDDFWRMIWEQMSSVIVMLTKLEERGRRKCDQYWPERGMKNYGPIQVTLKETLNMSHYTLRKFIITHKLYPGDDRVIKQFHFTAWPDHGVPSHPTPLLSLVRHTFSANRESVGPMVVHCSAGVGRTGTFVTLDVMLQRISLEDSVDVFGFVRQMRYQRNFMVQTEAQYVFIHDALLEAITCGVTEVEAKDLGSRIRELRQFDPETGYTYLENEFCRLAKEENHPIAFKSASLNCNAAKNRYANILPFESTRVHLKMRPGEMGSDYINANFIDGYCQPRAYIATQAPIPDTFDDFWRMIWEQESATVVMLTREEEAGKIKCHRYWPSEGSRLHGGILVELMEEGSYTDYVARKFKMTHTEFKESRTVTQFQYIDWPDTGLPDSGVGIVDLIGQVQKWQQQSGNTIIVIHCSGGVGRTGVFCGISMMIERLKAEGVIDVFQTVQAMRLQRPAMVQTAEQYEFCYTTLQEYLDSFDLYANFQ